MRRVVFLLVFSLVSSENSSSDNINVGPIVNRFSPGNSSFHSGRQLFKDISSRQNGVEKVSDKFYEEYLYDDDAVEIQGVAKEHIETMPVNPRTTMAIESSTQSSAQWTNPTVSPTIIGTFVTLLVDEVTYTSSPDVLTVKPERQENHRPHLKLVQLNDGDVVHRRKIKLRDQEELQQKHNKRPDWRKYWRLIPVRKRTLVSNDVGGSTYNDEDMPLPPPGSQLIQVIQNKVRTTRESFRENFSKFLDNLEEIEDIEKEYEDSGKEWNESLNVSVPSAIPLEQESLKRTTVSEEILNRPNSQSTIIMPERTTTLNITHTQEPLIRNTASVSNTNPINQRNKFELALVRLNLLKEDIGQKVVVSVNKPRRTIAEIFYDPNQFDFFDSVYPMHKTTPKPLPRFSNSRLGPKLKTVSLNTYK